MTIGSIGSNNYYMGQMYAMGSRTSFAGSGGGMSQNVTMGNGMDRVDIFSKTDEDGSGGLDQTEFQALADKISEATGEEVDVESLFATYDEDGDGVLSQEETDAAMEANRPEGPPPGGMTGGMGGMQGGAPPDPSQMFTDADEDEDGSLDETEFDTLAEIISEATGEDVDVEELFATYDEDEDGVLSEDETIAALEANRPEGPPTGGMQSEAQGSGYAMSAGIGRYMQAAAFGAGQGGNNSGFSAMFGGNSNNYFTGTLGSINMFT